MSTFDYVVVGAGSAGALIANRLSADANNTVLLIEAGGEDNYHWIHIPVGYLYCIDNPKTDWRYRTEADAGLNGRSLIYPRGKTLGGCSSINGMIYMRGQARDYADWARQTGSSEWNWQNCLNDFLAHESNYRFDDPNVETTDPDLRKFHAGQGEWRVEKQRLSWEILEAFSAAAQQAGIPATDDFNRGNNFGVGYFEVNQRKGWRWNTSKAFLRPIMKQRGNLQVWTHSQAKKLIIERNSHNELSCNGVVLVKKGREIVVRARKQVVLCAGSIGTPQLLQLSGIGPGQVLHRHGIPVLLDQPAVGANLQDHLQIRAVFKVQGVKTLNTLASGLLGKAQIGLQYLFKRSGPMSMAPSQLGAFAKSSPDQPHPNVQYHVQPLSLPAFGQPLHRFNAFTASVCNLNPSSRGTVHIRSANYQDAPLICPNYLSTPEDRKVAADSLRLTRTIAMQPALAKYQPEEFKPGVEFQSDDDLVRLAGDIATTIFHPVGTAKMGKANDPSAVVDPQLRVIGVSGLRVADASVMPTITSGNTNSPTLMIAEKAARWILQDC